MTACQTRNQLVYTVGTSSLCTHSELYGLHRNQLIYGLCHWRAWCLSGRESYSIVAGSEFDGYHPHVAALCKALYPAGMCAGNATG